MVIHQMHECIHNQKIIFTFTLHQNTFSIKKKKKKKKKKISKHIIKRTLKTDDRRENITILHDAKRFVLLIMAILVL